MAEKKTAAPKSAAPASDKKPEYKFDEQIVKAFDE